MLGFNLIKNKKLFVGFKIKGNIFVGGGGGNKNNKFKGGKGKGLRK